MNGDFRIFSEGIELNDDSNNVQIDQWIRTTGAQRDPVDPELQQNNINYM